MSSPEELIDKLTEINRKYMLAIFKRLEHLFSTGQEAQAHAEIIQAIEILEGMK